MTRVDSPALTAAGVTAGLEILKIDGVPVHKYVETRRRPYQASNSPQHVAVKLYSYGLLAGPRDRPVAVEFRSREGRVFEKRLARTPYPDATQLPVVVYRKLAGNLAYVALNTFNREEAQKEFERLHPEIRNSAGLILDDRVNDGGSGVMAYHVLAYLTPKDFATPAWKSRQYVATLRVGGTAGGWYEAKPAQWAGHPNDFYGAPVVMLIGPRSLSATDVFAETFQLLGRGKLIGGGSCPALHQYFRQLDLLRHLADRSKAAGRQQAAVFAQVEIQLGAVPQIALHMDRGLIRQAGEVNRSLEAQPPRALNLLSSNSEDIRFACLEICNFFGINIETSHLEARLGQKQRQRQPHIPKPNHADLSGAGLQTVHALLRNLR